MHSDSASPVRLEDIRSAATTITGKVLRTPLVRALALEERLGCELWLKLDSLQRTGSFKERGACNKIAALTPEQRAAGVIACSAGNHAQAVAYHATREGIASIIVMPSQTPFNKVEKTRRYGARVELVGETLAESETHARALAAAEGYTFVHPYDDVHVIAGQGTCGLEILEDNSALDVLVVPIGGGGLIGGIATAVKALAPHITIIGVEAELYASMAMAVGGHGRVMGGATIAEGIAVKKPGELTRQLVEQHVSQIVQVGEGYLEKAVQLLTMGMGVLAEGAGAAGVAAMLARPELFRGRRVGTIVCGANIDSRVLASVLMRGLVRDGKLVRLRVEITDAPGALSTITGVIAERGGNVVEVYHKRLFEDLPIKQADVDFVLETRDRQHAQDIADALNARGTPARLMPAVD
jgi:threonine dehydratase